MEIDKDKLKSALLKGKYVTQEDIENAERYMIPMQRVSTARINKTTERASKLERLNIQISLQLVKNVLFDFYELWIAYSSRLFTIQSKSLTDTHGCWG